MSNEHFVLIRGLLRESRHWADFPRHLQQHFPHARISALDIPGNGSLCHLTSPSNIPTLTDALRQQVDANQPLTLIAISMGGMIAIDWMRRFPAQVHAAILINTSLRHFAPFYLRLRWQNYPAIASLLLSPPRRQEQTILNLTTNLPHPVTVVDNWLQWRKQNPVSRRSALNQLIAAARFVCHEPPTPPTLLVASRQDCLVDYRCTRTLHDAWNKKLAIHPGAGHDLPLDDPAWLSQTISAWLQQTDS